MRDFSDALDPNNALRVMESVFERGFVAPEHAAIITPARTLGAELRDFIVVHVRVSEIAAGTVVGGVAMVPTDRKLRGRVVCPMLVQEDVRAAVRCLAVAEPELAPAPAPAFVYPVPVGFALHDADNVAAGSVFIAQEDPAGAALERVGAAGRPRRASKRRAPAD